VAATQYFVAKDERRHARFVTIKTLLSGLLVLSVLSLVLRGITFGDLCFGCLASLAFCSGAVVIGILDLRLLRLVLSFFFLLFVISIFFHFFFFFN